MKNHNEMDFFEKIESGDEKLKSYVNLYEGLANFITDYEMLKGKSNLSQKDIAKSMGTTQSAVSRIEVLKTNPSYKTLQNLSSAVKGNLFLTPMGNMTITVPYDLQEKVQEIANSEKLSVKEYLLKEVKKAVDSQYEIESKKFWVSGKVYQNSFKCVSNFDKKEICYNENSSLESDFSFSCLNYE